MWVYLDLGVENVPNPDCRVNLLSCECGLGVFRFWLNFGVWLAQPNPRFSLLVSSIERGPLN
jgi:hypothetical protein